MILEQMKKMYFKIPKKIRIFVIALVVVAAIFLVGRFFTAKSTVTIPADFQSARQKANNIAQEIINLSNASAKNIGEIARLSDNGKYGDAINLTLYELNRNAEMRQKALGLNEVLMKMAQSASQFSSKPYAHIAVEAVAVEIELASRLLNYNDYLSQILDILKQRILGETYNYSKINVLIGKANEEANIITETHNKFNELLKNLDETAAVEK